MKPTTLSLFEQEMRDQVAAARAALTEAELRGEPLLVQAAASHLDGLVDLARRNGVGVDDEPAEAAEAAGVIATDPLPAPAV
jgi:hypothetical protein